MEHTSRHSTNAATYPFQWAVTPIVTLAMRTLAQKYLSSTPESTSNNIKSTLITWLTHITNPPKTTLRDYLPKHLFDIENFTSSTKHRTNNAGKILSTYFTIVAACCLTIGAYIAAHMPITNIPMNTSMGPVMQHYSLLTMNTMFTSSIISVPFLFIGLILANNLYDPDHLNGHWNKQYARAWKSSIHPEMIKSMNRFHALPSTNSQAYNNMYKLAETIEQEINQSPYLDPRTNFDETPTFVTLNRMIDAYKL